MNNAATLRISILSSKTQLGRLVKYGRSIGCGCVISAEYDHYLPMYNGKGLVFLNEETNPYLACLVYIHELGHHIDYKHSPDNYEGCYEDNFMVMYCEIQAWMLGLSLANELNVILPKNYRYHIKKCLYSYSVDRRCLHRIKRKNLMEAPFVPELRDIANKYLATL